MKFSIITCTRNSAANLKECIDSANSQIFSDIEHVFIDGNSTDNTPDLIRSLARRGVKLISEFPSGIYNALNTGIRNSEGEIIGILHSDDLFADNMVLQEINDKFLETSADVVYGDLLYVDKNDPGKIIRYWQSCSFNNNLMRKGWMPPHPTMFVRKEVYLRYGFFDPHYTIAADYDFILRVLQKRELKIEYLPNVITKMRMGGASNRSIKNLFIKSSEDYSIIKKNNIPFPLMVLMRKNLSKVSQFFSKRTRFSCSGKESLCY
jgi:glycosyltransferase